MGEEHPCDQKNCGETTQEKLLCGGTCDPIGVIISTTRHKEYRRRILGRIEDALEKLFDSHFLWKVKNSLIQYRYSKYDAGQ